MGARERRLTPATHLPGSSCIAVLACAFTLSASAVRPAMAQTPPHPGRAPWSRMHTLLEKTFLKIDVLTVDVCFDDPTASEFARIAEAGRLDGSLGDSIARIALRGQFAVASMDFLRNISLERFLEGIDEDQRNAVARGFMADSVYRAIHSSLPEWFAFLEQRGVRKGDRVRYEFEPDAVRTTYIAYPDGSVLLDRRDIGRERRNSVLATWLAPGSPFRSGLLRSLERADAGAAGTCGALGQGALPVALIFRSASWRRILMGRSGSVENSSSTRRLKA